MNYVQVGLWEVFPSLSVPDQLSTIHTRLRKEDFTEEHRQDMRVGNAGDSRLSESPGPSISINERRNGPVVLAVRTARDYTPGTIHT